MKDRPLLWMIVFGLVRVALVYVGAKLEAWNVIDSITRERLISDGAAQAVGWLLIAAGAGWSVLQKTQMWSWLLTALQADKRVTRPEDVPEMAPGPDVAI